MVEFTDLRNTYDFYFEGDQIIPQEFLERLRSEWKQYTERLHANRKHSKLHFTYYSEIDNYRNTVFQYLEAQKVIQETNKKIEDCFEMIKSKGLCDEQDSIEVQRIRQINTVIEEEGEDSDDKEESQNKKEEQNNYLKQEQFHQESEESLTVQDYQEQDLRMLFDSDLEMVEQQDNYKNQLNYQRKQINYETQEQQCNQEDSTDNYDDKTVLKQIKKNNRQFTNESHRQTVKNMNQEQVSDYCCEREAQKQNVQRQQGSCWQNQCSYDEAKISNEKKYNLLLNCCRNLNEELIQEKDDYQGQNRCNLTQRDAVVEQLSYVEGVDQDFEDKISSSLPVQDEKSILGYEIVNQQQQLIRNDRNKSFSQLRLSEDGYYEDQFLEKSKESSQQEMLWQGENDNEYNNQQQTTEKLEFLCQIGPENITITLSDCSSKKQLSQFKKSVARLLSQL